MEDVKHRQVFVPGGVLHICNTQPSFTEVLRAVKRQEHGLLNCIASVVHDAQFVEEVAGLFPGLPLLANLRCGLWYVPRPAATCYFKSTDGHSGQWSFSTTRLNLHVAAAAARHGGVLVVDATRRGKSFPDALTKTVPIWAAVINRAVLRLREGSLDASDWDDDVHLPPWISPNEQAQIRQRLCGWTEELRRVGADLSGLAAALRKPLRCIWVSQDGAARLAGAPDPGTLHFTPVVLVSASLSHSRQRRRLRLADLTPPLDLMYDYVPGAGDDEESWARGLTPPLLWRHRGELLRAGVGGIAASVARVVWAERRVGAGAGPSTSGPAAAHDSTGPAEGSVALGDAPDVRWVGSTRLALGRLPPRSSSDAWGEYNHGRAAVLFVGLAAHGSMAAEPGTAMREAPGGGFVVGGPCTRHLHLPVAGGKADKRALLRRLPAAAQFASHHLAAGGAVLVAYDDTDCAPAAVCVLLACLLACFGIEDVHERPQLRWRQPAAVEAGTCTLCPAAPGFSRVTVRQYLAALAPHVPQAVPGKALLKQVYNAFLLDRLAPPA